MDLGIRGGRGALVPDFQPGSARGKFDPEGRYVKTYLPELARIPPRYLHCPWTAPSSLLDNAGIGKDSPYRNPIVDLGLSRKRALQAWTSGNTPDVTPS